VPAGRLGRAPRRASGCDGTGGAAVGCAGWASWVGEKGRLTRGVHWPATKGEGEAVRVNGLKGVAGWAGCQAKEDESGPAHILDI
jgi:hypothetical protein